jgi:hypothetical protein
LTLENQAVLELLTKVVDHGLIPWCARNLCWD